MTRNPDFGTGLVLVFLVLAILLLLPYHCERARDAPTDFHDVQPPASPIGEPERVRPAAGGAQ